MKNKLICIICAIIGILIALNSQQYTIKADELDIMAPARAMVVLEGYSGDILYSFNADKQLPMASTTKIATAIVAIENCENLDEKFRVSDKAVGIEGTSIYLKKGEELSMRELLYGLILASGNDCAVAIAEYFEGEENFVAMMNQLVIDLGLENTNFTNPHGLDEDSHYTSAYDLATITAYALKNPVFKEIVSTKKMTIEPTSEYQTRYLKHKNRLLFQDDHCIGVKTGFTDNAGRCLVNAHEENGMQIISVVLNCQPMFEECDRLTKLALENYTMKEFVEPYTFVSNIPVNSSKTSEIGVVTVEGFSKPILKVDEELYDIKYHLPESIDAPVGLNQVVGTVEVLFKDELIYSGHLITIESAENNEIRYVLDNIIDKWF